MIPKCTIKGKYDPDLYVLIIIMIQKKKGYNPNFFCNTDKFHNKILSNIMVPLIKYIYSISTCVFCKSWCYPICDNCLYYFHKKNCDCNRTEFFYNLSWSGKEKTLVFCDKIKKQERIFYFW